MKFEKSVITYKPKAIPEVELNQKVRISKGKKFTDNRKNNPEDIFEGEVVSINSKHMTVKNKLGIKESFKYADFIDGYVRML